MKRVKTEDLAPGMRLARPIEQDGAIVLAEGADLTAPLIERIKALHILSVCVEGRAETLVPREQALEELARRFRSSDDSPPMGMLKRVMREHIAGLYDGCDDCPE